MHSFLTRALISGGVFLLSCASGPRTESHEDYIAELEYENSEQSAADDAMHAGDNAYEQVSEIVDAVEY